MHGHLIFLLSFLVASTAVASGKSKKPTPERCNNVIQMGLMNSLIDSGKLAEHFPGMPKESLDFLKADFERVRQATEKANRTGKAPPDHMLEQLIQRTQLTDPTPGKRVPVKGRSTLSSINHREVKYTARQEEVVARNLSDMGYDVRFNDGTVISPSRLKQEGLDPRKKPDLEVNGRTFDILTTYRDTDVTVTNVIQKIQVGQTHRVVIDASYGASSGSAMKKIRKELHEKNPDGLHEVLILRNNNGTPELTRVFP